MSTKAMGNGSPKETESSSGSFSPGLNLLEESSEILPPPWYHHLLSIDSFLGAFLTLFGSTVGSGMLALPYAFQAAGWPLAVSTLFLAVVLNFFTSSLLIRVAEEQNSSTMDMLSHHVFEGKTPTRMAIWLRIAAQVTVFIFNYGTLISYLIAVRAMQTVNAIGDDLNTDKRWYFTGMCMFMAAALAFPLCLVNNIASLRYFSIISFLSPVYLTFFLMGSYGENEHSYCSAEPCLRGEMISIPIILIATSCQDNMGDIYQDLGNKKRNGPLVLTAVLAVTFFLFLAVGQLGCMHFHQVNTNVLQDSKFLYSSVSGHIVYINQALYSMAVALICDIPFLVYPALRVIYPLLWRQNYRDSSLKKKAMMVGGTAHIVTLFSAACCGIWLTGHFLIVMSAVGILSCIYISGALPCLLYLKGAPQDDPKWLKYSSAAVLIVTVAVGLVSFGFMIMIKTTSASYC